MNLYEKINQWASVNPSKPAFLSQTGALDYDSLETHSNALSFFIHQTFKQDHEPIIVYGHMESDMMISFLACAKSGHPYIPIDVSVPEERVLRIAEDSKAIALFSIGDLLSSFSSLDIPVFSQSDIHAVISENIGKKAPPGQQNIGDDTFYIIYTSGSTGSPKGVQISYNNLLSFTEWAVKEFGIEQGKIILNQAPFSFDLSVMDLYPSLFTNSTLFALHKELMTQPKQLFQHLEDSSVNVWVSTPSFVDFCLTNEHFSENTLKQLDTFLFCGEVLTNKTASVLLSRFPSAKIFNTYGPTESTVAVTSIHLTKEILSAFPVLPVGKIKNDCQILIVDEEGNSLPEGEKGEVVIVGPSVGKGYFRKKELSEKSFLTIYGLPAYKTGDAGYLKNEQLFYGGRLDFQVKLHGYRMELEEIEHHLRTVEYVKSAVVIPIYIEGKCQSLTAVIVPNAHSFEKMYQLTSAIKKELGAILPSYMIPKKIVYKEALPMTNNGKVDRKTLLNEVSE